MANPMLLGYSGLLGWPSEAKMKQLGQALWETNLNAPIRGAYNLMNTPYDVLMGADSPEKEQAVADAFDAAGGVTVGSMPIPKPANSLSMGIKAYHGSPHSFDKFSMDKIGTGEGAQAYGHGLYFAENEGVAKGYRDTLAKDIVSMDGTAIPHDAPGAETIYRLANHMNQMGQTADEVIADAVGRAQKLSGDLNSTDHYKQSAAKAAADWANAVAPFSGKSLKWGRDPGSMYEVNIDADPNAFLDWDKPLSEQPEGVQKAYNKTLKGSLVTREIGNNENFGPLTDVSVPGGGSLGVFTKDQLPDVLANPAKYAPLKGGDMYNMLVERQHLNVNPPTPFLKSKADATGKLAKEGIPGIKYLDAGSRGAGDGTRNYVVFDDKLISIVRKYGIAGASAMLGYDVLTGANDAQAKAVQKADLDHTWDNWLKSGGI